MTIITKTLSMTIYTDSGDVGVRKATIYSDGESETILSESNDRYTPSLSFRKQPLLDALEDCPSEQAYFDTLWTQAYMESKGAVFE